MAHFISRRKPDTYVTAMLGCDFKVKHYADSMDERPSVCRGRIVQWNRKADTITVARVIHGSYEPNYDDCLTIPLNAIFDVAPL